MLHAGANYPTPDPSLPPHLEGITHLLLQNEIPLESTLAYLRAAGRKGLTNVFNPSPMLSADSLRAFAWPDLTWLIVNEGELESLLSAFDALQPREGGISTIQYASDLVIALHRCPTFAPSVSVLCTLGAQGILYFEAPGKSMKEPIIHHLPAAPLLKPLKDTTGAGDCFAGYFVAGLMTSPSGTALSRILQESLTVSCPASRTSSALMRIVGLCIMRGEHRCDGKHTDAQGGTGPSKIMILRNGYTHRNR